MIPLHKGGDPWDMENLRTLCRACHIKVSASERNPPPAGSEGWAEIVRNLAAGAATMEGEV